MGAMVGWVCLCALTVWADLPRWQNTYTVFLNAYRNSGHFIACDQLGSLLYTRQEYQQSLVVCNRGLEQNPQYASLYNTRGGDYYMLNDFDRAFADFDRAIKIRPDFSPPYRSRALIHLQRKQFGEAQADFAAYVQHGGQLNNPKPNLPPQ
jgi:tetratricopeptide (TPR) repeat protein